MPEASSHVRGGPIQLRSQCLPWRMPITAGGTHWQDPRRPHKDVEPQQLIPPCIEHVSAGAGIEETEGGDTQLRADTGSETTERVGHTKVKRRNTRSFTTKLEQEPRTLTISATSATQRNTSKLEPTIAVQPPPPSTSTTAPHSSPRTPHFKG